VEQPLKDANGKIETDKNGNPKADSNLRDYENIPLLCEQNGKLVKQTIEEYFEREVKPHVPDAWIDESKTKVGYEINFTKYFYEFKPLRPLEEIRRDMLALEQETESMIKTVIEE
jgi:type I restriction enzyme M protein